MLNFNILPAYTSKSYIIILAFFFFSSCNSTPEETTANNTNQEMNSKITPPKKDERKRIIFFGNSLTAAYGLDPSEGFVSLIQEKINTENLNYKVVNAGLSGETTAGGKERIDWILKQPLDIFILELGGNDGLRGIDPKESDANLKAIIEKVRAAYPSAKIVLAGMEAPPNMGEDFTSAFRQMYPRLAETYKLALIPFLLEGVGGDPDLNLADGIHPNKEGHQIVSETIWEVLKPLL